MLRSGNEQRAYWLFLFWVIFITLAYQPHLAAQEDDMFVVEDEAAPGAPAADKTTSEKPAEGDNPEKSSSAASADEDAVVEEQIPDEEAGDSNEGDPTELPALSADPVELLAKVNGVARSGKHDEVIKQLEEHEDAVAESKELLALYVEALIKVDKVDWNKVNRFAKMLSGKDKTSSLADYAQGMYFLNAKKPDASKAITFLGKARSAKKPYPDAAMAYYMAMGKKFWPVGLLLVALPVVVIIKKKRAGKKVEIDLGFDTNPESGSSDSDAGIAAASEILSGDVAVKGDGSLTADPQSSEPDATAEAKKEGTVKKVKKIVTRKVVAKSGASQSAEPVVADNVDGSERPENSEVAQEPVVPEKTIPEIQAPRPAPQAPYRPGLTGVKPAAAEETPAAVTQPAESVRQPYASVQARHQAEIDKIREMSRPVRPEVVPVDPELDALWGNLSRKAMQGKIGPQFRREDQLGSFARNSVGNTYSADNTSTSQDQVPMDDVSIDLSEESLKDDLVCKLKMMAISDSELRELFAQKNPRHIPHLIEYVLTRPEPVRLAFVTRELGNYEDPAVIDMLASLLYNEDHRVALAAIQGLEKTKKIAAVIHICPFLRSEIPLLAQAARAALANFGAVKILQAFKNLPSHPDVKIREAGIFVLSRMQGNAVEELLKTMLSDSSLEIRNSVILAMSYQKNPVYIDVLREFFRVATDEDKTLARKAIVYLQGFVVRKK